MTIKKRLDQERLQAVIERLEEIQCELDDIIDGTTMEDHFKAYSRYGLNQLLGNGNRYDSDLHSLIENEEADWEEGDYSG